MAYKTISRREACGYLKQLQAGGKTPISLAMELATKLGVVAEFQETKDLKWSTTSFKYSVRLGDIQTFGVGGSKKEAKQNSAKELIKLIENESEISCPNSPSRTPKYEPIRDESYSSFSSPSPSLSSSTSDSLCDRNVVGELQNLAAKNRWQLPIYEYGEPTGEPHSKTFTCLVRMMSGLQCTGVDSSKKAAKKQAAEKMLDLLEEDGTECDVVDARTPMSQTLPYSNYSNSSPEILNDSDLEDYNTNCSDSASPAGKMDFSTEIPDDLKYDEIAEQKLQSCSEKDGFDIEYIELPNKSLKGLYQVFVKLMFTRNKDKQKHPIVTHGSGETREIAKQRAAERARKHLDLMLSVQ